MDTTKTLHSGKLLVFAALSFADFMLTAHLLQRNGGHVYEGNPIASAWLNSYGWAGLAMFKSLMVLLVVGLCLVISRHRPRVGGRVLQLGCFVTGGVVLYSCFLSGLMNARPLPLKLAAAI